MNVNKSRIIFFLVALTLTLTSFMIANDGAKLADEIIRVDELTCKNEISKLDESSILKQVITGLSALLFAMGIPVTLFSLIFLIVSCEKKNG